jgi:hypothetical protein
MAKKKLTREEKRKGKRERKGLEPEPPGVPEQYEVEDFRKEIEQLDKLSFVPQAHGRIIRLRVDGSTATRSFIREAEYSAWDILWRLMKLREMMHAMFRLNTFQNRKLRDLRAIEKDETMIRKQAGEQQAALNAKLREERSVNAQMREHIKQLEVELEEAKK